jgi:hypothetical protein
MDVNDNSVDAVAKSLIVDTAPVAAKPERVPTPLKPIATENEEKSVETEEENDDVQANEEIEAEAEAPEEVDDEEVDLDSIEIDVPVDGETKKVSLKDLKARYAGEGAIEKRLQEATEVRTQVAQQSQYHMQAIEAQVQRIKQLDEIIAKNVEPNINWDELRARDPGRYLLERDKKFEADAKRSQLAQEQQRLMAEHQNLQNAQMTERAKAEAQILIKKIPDLAIPEKAEKLTAALVEAGVSYGFAPKEIDEVFDHRAMLVLHDAMQYRALMAGKKAETMKTTQNPLKTLVRPASSAGRSTMTSEKKAELDTYKKAKSSGKVDDVAKFLITNSKKSAKR